MVVALIGFMGAGKTSTGSALAEELGWPFVDLDRYITHKTGRSPSETILSEGENFFRAVEAEAVRDIVAKSAMTGENCVLSLGGGTPMTRSLRHLIFEECFCVYLEAGLETLLSRIEGTEDRPLLKMCDAESLLKSRIPVYRLCALSVNTENLSPHQCAATIKSKLPL